MMDREKRKLNVPKFPRKIRHRNALKNYGIHSVAEKQVKLEIKERNSHRLQHNSRPFYYDPRLLDNQLHPNQISRGLADDVFHHTPL